jgi:tetratricopeptide (TPR) repeat protein
VNQDDWKVTNHKAAEFWTKKVNEIETINDALTAFEAYYHYYEISDFSLAGSTIVKMRKNRWEETERLGKSFGRLGLIQKMIDVIEIIKGKELIEPDYILSHLYNILGGLYWITGKIHLAFEHHKKSSLFAENVLKKGNYSAETEFWSKRLKGFSLYNQGLYYIETMEFEQALHIFEMLYQKRVEIVKNGNYLENGKFLNEPTHALISALALVYSKNEMYDKAISFADLLNEAILIPCLDAWEQGYSRLFLGMTYYTIHDFAKAEVLFNHAINYAKESNYSQIEGKALNSLAVVYRENEKKEEAVIKHLLSIKILRKIGATCDLAEAYFQLGLTYQTMGEHDQAEEYKAKALKLFAQMEAPKQIERVNKAFGGNIQ